MMGVCTSCGGWGRPKAGCTCSMYRTIAGRTGIIANWNPECPVHTEDPKGPSKGESDVSLA